MSSEANFRLHSLIDGRVQGVGFRNFVLIKAEELDLTGWVRNTYQGQVEVLAEGPRPALEIFFEQLKVGPGPAFVTTITQDWEPATGEFPYFAVRHTSY
jgi:acylphosphatase